MPALQTSRKSCSAGRSISIYERNASTCQIPFSSYSFDFLISFRKLSPVHIMVCLLIATNPSRLSKLILSCFCTTRNKSKYNIIRKEKNENVLCKMAVIFLGLIFSQWLRSLLFVTEGCILRNAMSDSSVFSSEVHYELCNTLCWQKNHW